MPLSFFFYPSQKLTTAIEVRLIDEAFGPVVVENSPLIAVKLHCRARKRRPEACEGQSDVLLRGQIQWDSPHRQ